MTRHPSTFATRRVLTQVVVVLSAASLVACATSDDGATQDPTDLDQTTMSPTPTAPVTSAPATPMDSDQVTDPAGDSATAPASASAAAQVAVQQLAERLGTDDIQVVEAAEVTFPNGALGCPQPDRMYTQALVDGYWIVLGNADRVWLFTGGDTDVPVLCETDAPDGGAPAAEGFSRDF